MQEIHQIPIEITHQLMDKFKRMNEENSTRFMQERQKWKQEREQLTQELQTLRYKTHQESAQNVILSKDAMKLRTLETHHKSTIEKLKRQLEERSNMEVLQSEYSNEGLQRHNEQLQQEVQVLKQNLSNEATNYRKQLQFIQDDYNLAQKRQQVYCMSLEQQLSSLKQHSRTSQHESAELQALQHKYQEDTDQYNTEINELTEQLAMLKTKSADMLKQNTQLKDQIKSLQQGNISQLSQLAETKDQFEGLILQIHKDQENSINKYKQQLLEQQSKYDKLSAQFIKTQKYSSELQMQLEWSNIALEEQKASQLQMEKKLAELQEQIEKTHTQQQQSDQQLQMIDELTQNQQILDNMRKQLDDKSKQIELLQGEIDDLHNQIDKAQQEIKKQGIEFQKLESELEMKLQWADLNNQELTEELEELQAQQGKQDPSQLLEEIDRLKKDLSNAIEQTEQFKDQSNKLRRSVSEIKEQISQSSNINTLLRRNSAKTSQDEQPDQQISLEVEIKELKLQIKALNDEIGEYEENQQSQEIQLKQYITTNQALTSEKDELLQRYTIAYNQVNNYTDQSSKLKEMLDDKEGLIEELQELISKHKTDIHKIDQYFIQNKQQEETIAHLNIYISKLEAEMQQQSLMLNSGIQITDEQAQDQNQLLLDHLKLENEQLREQLNLEKQQDNQVKINRILMENEEFRILQQQNIEMQENLLKKEQYIDQLQTQLLYKSQITSPAEQKQKQKTADLLEKIADNQSDLSNSSIRSQHSRKETQELFKKIGKLSLYTASYLSAKLDYMSVNNPVQDLSKSLPPPQ